MRALQFHEAHFDDAGLRWLMDAIATEGADRCTRTASEARSRASERNAVTFGVKHAFELRLPRQCALHG